MKAAELAKALGTTPGFLSQVIAPLIAHGWVQSEPGPTGGYAAVASPRRVSVLDLIEAVEGRTDTERCVLEGRPCVSGEPCALHGAWSRARGQMLGELARTSLYRAAREP